MPESWLFDTPEGLLEIVGEDLVHLASTGRTPTYATRDASSWVI